MGTSLTTRSRKAVVTNQSLMSFSTSLVTGECGKPVVLPGKRKRVKWLLSRIRSTALWSAGVSLAPALLVYLDSEWDHMQSSSSSISTLMRVAIIVLSVTQVLLVLQYHYLRVRLLSCLGKINAPKAWHALWSEPPVRYLLCAELVINGVFVPPLVNDSHRYEQLGTYSELSLEDFLMPFIYLRLYHIVRACFYLNNINVTRAIFYLELHNIESHFKWLAKMQSKTSGFLSAFLIAGLYFLVSALVLRVYEHDVPGSTFSLWASLWFSAVSQCGIGYGDLTPKTHLGRISISIAIFVGVFILSLLVKGMHHRCGLDLPQATLALAIKDQLISKQLYRHQAVQLIQKRWRLHRKRLRGEASFHYMLEYVGQLLRFRKLLVSGHLHAHPNILLKTISDQFQRRLHMRIVEISEGSEALSLSLRTSGILVVRLRDTRVVLSSIRRTYAKLLGETSVQDAAPQSRRGSQNVRMKRSSNLAIKKILLRRSIVITPTSRSRTGSDS